ncbi:MAG TPA: nucleoside recognition protein [Candidatus Eisenbergiella intestinipullorum]|nr:nucleoside recognition protein [Candidatus Eisenbergiella intestinipullorum]
MLNYIWAAMIAIGILYAALTGNMEAVANGALDSAGEAVQLCITMTGVMGLWVGLMEIASSSGLVQSLTRGIQPFITFLFPRIPKDHPARQHISTNIIANILGLGWACTPAGLKAMEELEKLEEDRRTGRAAGPAQKKGTASNEMCTFLILNISSLQLIPVNVIAYRSQYGSAAPASIVGAGILATAVSTAVAVVFCKVMDRKL